MPSTEARQIGIMRPRQSLSCVVCRRRKVRCGKEQPACGNCVRINETCEYESNTPDLASRQAKRKPTNPPSHAERVPSPPATEQPLSAWTAQQRHSPPGQPFNIDPRIETDESSDRPTASHHPLPASSSVDHQQSGNTNGSHRPFSHTLSDLSNPFFHLARAQDLSLASKSLPLWNTSSQEDRGHPLQLPTPSLAASTAGDSGFLASPKRRRTVEDHASATNQDTVLEHQTHRRKRTATSVDSANSDVGEDTLRPVGYLSVQKGGRTRHVGNAFWGLIKGHESLCETFLGEKYDIPDNVPLPYIDSLGLAELLTTLPQKEVCDALLQSFLISVYPIHPLIHSPTFQTDYNNFWQWCRNSDISQPDNKLLGDPTFLCLLFSVLYCGATVSPLAMWMADTFQDVEKNSTVERLRKTYSTSLSMCQYPQHPTFYALVSSLLVHTCSRLDAEPFEDSKFVGMVLRLAQNMGLHRDGSSFGLDNITSELRRRVWWHIVWLDVHTSILHGSQLCCSSNQAENNVKMISEARDEDISMMTNGLGSRGLPPSPSATSITMLLATGRFETARFKHFLVNELDTARDLGKTQFGRIFGAAKRVQTQLDQLIARVPTQGIRETGFIPSRLANASPLTHEWLYSDGAGQATVWSSWAKNMLIMLRTEVAILVQKPFLVRADSKSKQQQKMWNSVLQLCITYLRTFMQLVRIPAFAPYSWFCINFQSPLQPTFLILTYLQDNKNCGSASGSLARHFVDEVLDVFGSPDERSFPRHEDHGHATPGAASFDKQVPLPWKMLLELRDRIDRFTYEEGTHFKPAAPTRCQLISPAIALRTMSLSSSGKSSSSAAASRSEIAPPAVNGPPSPPIDPMADNGQYDSGGDSERAIPLDTSDFEAWCSSLTQDADAYLGEGQGGAESAHETLNAHLELGVGSARLGEMLDYFGD